MIGLQESFEILCRCFFHITTLKFMYNVYNNNSIELIFINVPSQQPDDQLQNSI